MWLAMGCITSRIAVRRAHPNGQCARTKSSGWRSAFPTQRSQRGHGGPAPVRWRREERHRVVPLPVPHDLDVRVLVGVDAGADRDAPAVVDVAPARGDREQRLAVRPHVVPEPIAHAREAASLLAAEEEVHGPERAGGEHHPARAEHARSLHEWTRGGDRADLVPAAHHRPDVGDLRLGVDDAAAPLRQEEVVPVERVLRAVPAPGHAAAAQRAAGARRALAAEVRIRVGPPRLLSVVHADGVAREGAPSPGLLLHRLAQEPIGGERLACDRRAEHEARHGVVRREQVRPGHARGPARILERARGRDEQGVRVHEAAAADARTVQDEDVLQDGDLLDAIAEQPRHPERLAHVPVRRREVLGAPALAHLEHRDAVALLAEPQGGDRAAEAGADDDEVVVERTRHEGQSAPAAA